MKYRLDNFFLHRNPLSTRAFAQLKREHLLEEYRDAHNNTLLHWAVIKDRYQIAQNLAQDFPLLLSSANDYGYTPVDLVKILDKEHFFSWFRKGTKKIKLQHVDQYHEYTPQEFYQSIGVKYVPYLIFEDFSYLQWVWKRCRRAQKKNRIDSEQKWHGTYYDKELKEGYSPDVVIKWIDPVFRFGLFTNEDLSPNAYVGEYGGIVRRRRRSVIQKNDYCFEYLIANEDRTPFTIDAKKIGNYTRFINHSETPNLTPIAVFSQGIMHVVLRANRYISKGSELTYDYGPNYWAKREKPIAR